MWCDCLLSVGFDSDVESADDKLMMDQCKVRCRIRYRFWFKLETNGTIKRMRRKLLLLDCSEISSWVTAWLKGNIHELTTFPQCILNSMGSLVVNNSLWRSESLTFHSGYNRNVKLLNTLKQCYSQLWMSK